MNFEQTIGPNIINSYALTNGRGKAQRIQEKIKSVDRKIEFTEFSIEIIHLISEYFKIETLTSLSITSKYFEKLTGTAPLWINLCNKAKISSAVKSRSTFVSAIGQYNSLALLASAKLFSKNIDATPRIKLAILNLRSILLQKDLKYDFRIKILCRKQFLKFENAKEKHGGHGLKFLSKIIFNIKPPKKFVLMAYLKTAIVNMENPGKGFEDKVVAHNFKILKDVILQSEDFPKINNETKYFYAHFLLKYRDGLQSQKIYYGA